MKILYLHQYFLDRNSAGGTKSFEYADFLAKKGHQVTIITGNIHYFEKGTVNLPNFSNSIKVKKINLAKNFGKNFFERCPNFSIYAIMATVFGLGEKPDIIFATSPPLSIAIPAIILSKIKRIPLVFEVRDLWPDFAISLGIIKNPFFIKLAKALEKIAYKNSKKIVLASPEFKKNLLEKGVEDKKIEVIPNSADLELFSEKVDSKTAKKNLGIVEKKFVAMYAGAHNFANGLQTIIDAAEILKEQKEILIVLVGDGTQKKNLEKMVVEKNLENVLFLKSFSKKEMPKILAAADVCLLNLRNAKGFENVLPNKLLDYTAAGKFVITTVPGFSKKLVEEANAGIFCNPENSKELPEKILWAFNNKEKLYEIGLNGRKFIEKNFGRKNSSEKLEKALIECLEIK